MYVGEILGKTLKIPNWDYRALKKKWHPDNVVESKDGFGEITGKYCTLCRKYKDYKNDCPKCPFSVFVIPKLKKFGCTNLARKLCRNKVRVDFFNIHFLTTKKTAEKYMQKIQDILNTFEEKAR